MEFQFEVTRNMLKNGRVSNIRKYFDDHKEAERLKRKRRETILSNMMSGKYDYAPIIPKR